MGGKKKKINLELAVCVRGKEYTFGVIPIGPKVGKLIDEKNMYQYSEGYHYWPIVSLGKIEVPENIFEPVYKEYDGLRALEKKLRDYFLPKIKKRIKEGKIEGTLFSDIPFIKEDK